MARTRSATQAQTHGYEFFGPIGVSFMTLGLPLVCYLGAFLCNPISGCPTPGLLHPSTLSLAKLKEEVGWQGVESLLNTKTVIGVTAYYLFSLFLNVALPVTEVEGVELTTGGKLKYKFNAFSSAVTTLAIAAAGTALQGSSFVLWTFIWDNYVPLITANLIVASALSVFVYIKSFTVKSNNTLKRELAAGGHSGNVIYDWFIGRELNPRITLPFFGEIDIKSWMELRPGLLGWVLLDLAFMAHQYQNYGYVTDSMVIVVFAQALYVLDALYMEPAMLTTIDITTDGFGFMLAFGDLVWLPFVYSWQARYLATHPVHLGLSGCLFTFAVQGVGYYIFRASNNEKNRFRTNPKDPQVAHLSYIETKSGSRLITSGWWGTARHINYLGDWIMSFAYCLPTGIAGYVVRPSSPFNDVLWNSASDASIIKDDYSLSGGVEVVPGEARGWGMLFTYFFMLYFAVLLIHREARDEAKCRKKYGKDWDVYCDKVKSKIVPGIY